MKKTILMFGMMLAVTCYTTVFAQKPAVVTSNEAGWQHIGQTTASFGTQNESIKVLGADEFTAIRLKVTEAPLHIERLQVFYESGEMEEIDVRSEINANTETRVIKLKHPDRDINKVAFTYKTVKNSKGEKADVSLYGLKTGQPAGEDSYRDEKREIKKDAREAEADVKRETNEAASDVKRESNEAAEDVKRESNEAAEDVKREGQSAGDKVSEGVNDAAAAIKDEKVKDKVGPGNETVYLDDDGKYYYINNEGNKVNILKVQLKNKRDK